MNKIIVCPCKVKFWYGGWGAKMRWVKLWATGVAVASGESSVLVWVEGDPRDGVRDVHLTSVPKDHIRVIK